MPSQTDWKKVAAMTDDDVETATASDPDEAGLDDWIEQAIVTQPNKKQRVYALYDAYVIEFFKQGGRGYQARMNAVLKAYVDAQLAKREKSK
jgi:uncharacterized protein (DUF4415 family)